MSNDNRLTPERFEIETCQEAYCGSSLGYWTRGHVDKERFVDELDAEHFRVAQQDAVRHTYYRNVPCNDDDAGIAWWMRECQGPARGAYAVTWVDRDKTVEASDEQR